jgi:hypothetical protein
MTFRSLICTEYIAFRGLANIGVHLLLRVVPQSMPTPGYDIRRSVGVFREDYSTSRKRNQVDNTYNPQHSI